MDLLIFFIKGGLLISIHLFPCMDFPLPFLRLYVMVVIEEYGLVPSTLDYKGAFMKKLFVLSTGIVMALALTACSRSVSQLQDVGIPSSTAKNDVSTSSHSEATTAVQTEVTGEQTMTTAPSSQEGNIQASRHSKASSAASSKNSQPAATSAPTRKSTTMDATTTRKQTTVTTRKQTTVTTKKQTTVTTKRSTTVKPTTPTTVPQVSGDRAKQVVALVNAERAKVNLPALSYHAELSSNAMVRAREIVSKFDHTRPDGSKFSTAITIPYRMVGENIAAGQRSPEEVMQAWMNSAGHRENILRAEYDKIGVGVVESGGRLYWVQLFAK